MSKKVFTSAERYAVFTAHGEKCYMCHEPVDLLSMQVDHIIPEALLEDPDQLLIALTTFGLPKDFDLQSFANWLPACGPCNNKKRARVFRLTPIIQTVLDIAAEKAARAKELASRVDSDRAVAKAWVSIEKAAAEGRLSEALEAAIRQFVAFHTPNRANEVLAMPLHLTPFLEVLAEQNGVRVVKGPYGVGVGPIVFDERSNFRCPSCGQVAWSGARCVACGVMDDD